MDRSGRLMSSLAASVSVLLMAALGACGGSSAPRSSATTDPASPAAGLVAPRTSPAQDAQFLAEVAQADPDLAAYEQKDGNVALRALLTDGSAFCAFLQRGQGIDDAMVSVAEGARGVESQTSLPLSVTTFNTVEAVALLALCPEHMTLLPPSSRARIQKLGQDLGTKNG